MKQRADAGSPPGGAGVKTYLCPARGRGGYSTAGANYPGWNGPFTDYKANWNSFDNRSNQDPNRLTMTQITNSKGTSATLYIGEGSLDVNEYSRNHGSNWEEVIYSGGYGGTGRGANWIMRDSAGIGQTDRWGGPHTSGALFLYVDGHVQVVNYAWSGNAFFAQALNWRDTNVSSLN